MLHRTKYMYGIGEDELLEEDGESKGRARESKGDFQSFQAASRK
jgi:hypothetical protein